MGWAGNRLGEWQDTGGILGFVRQAATMRGGTTAVVTVDAEGWECSGFHGGKAAGPEVGDAGRAAADKAAVAMGWELEGGPVTLPAPDLRLGQRVWNALAAIAPGSVEPYRGGPLDPFHDDARLPAFLEALEGGPVEAPADSNPWRALTEIARALARLRDGDPPDAWGADLAEPENAALVVAIIASRTERAAQRDDALAEVERLRAEFAEATRLVDFWSTTAKAAMLDRDEVQRDLRHTRSEREQALLQALGDIAVIWSRGVRP